MPSETDLGIEFRRLRKARGLSLTDVATATNISSSFLSMLENGKTDITFARLVRLVSFFEISITDLIPDPEPSGTTVVRHEARRRIASPKERAESQLLTHDTRHKMLPTIVVIRPGGTVAACPRIEGGEFFLLVLHGEIEAAYPDEAAIVLREQDAAYLSLDRKAGPSLHNRGACDAHILSVVTPPML